MTAFWTGFWAWATDHWFLGFVLLIISIAGVTTICKAFLRIFQRPQHKLTVNMAAPQGAETRQVQVPSTQSLERSLQDILAQTVSAPPRPVRRQTVWDRIRANADEDDE